MGEQVDVKAASPAVESDPKVQDPQVPMIPKPRLDQEIAKRRGLEEQLAAVQAERDELARHIAEVPDEPKAAPKAATPRAPTADSTRLASIMDLRLDHGLSRQAAEKVVDYQEKHGLSIEDSMELARKRHPEAFGGDRRGFDPSTHAMATPENGQPPPDKPKTDLNPSQKIAANRSRDLQAAQSAGLARARELIKAKVGAGRKT